MKHNQGFTLIELLVTMAILGILAGLAVVGYAAFTEAARLNSAAREMKARVELAKLQAIRRRAPVAMTFTTGVGNASQYTLFVDNGATTKTHDSGEEIIQSGSMPDNINLAAVSFPGGALRFNTVGLPENSSGAIEIRNANASKYRRINLGAAGTVKLEVSSDGTTWRE